MPFNGTGTFNRVYSWVTDAAGGILVRADRMDTDTNDIATGLSNCITRDGQSPPSANIPMATYRITGLGNGINPQDAVTFLQTFTSPAFTGVPTAPTAAVDTATTQIATTAYVVNQAYAKIASPTFTGTVVLPSTTSIGNVSATEISYLDGVTSALQTQMDLKAPLASPTLTGVPLGPTAALGTNTTQLATTAFVAGTAFASTLPAQTGNAGKFVTTDGTNASWADVLPSQTGNSGKYLTTNGTTASWAAVSAPGMTLLATATASSSATIDFTSLIDSTYHEYEIHFLKLIPATNGVNLYLLGSKDNGSAWLNSGYYYTNVQAANVETSGASTQIIINYSATGIRNVAGGQARAGASGVIRLANPSADRYFGVSYELAWDANGSTAISGSGGGFGDAGNTFTLNAVRLLMSSGNIASGEFKLYGLKKAV